ncbi:MAG: MFS transporter [Clostridia bacterium]|nr:MFS transporter [Clostridia bacterium]
MQKLNIKRTICIGAAFLSISAFWQLYDNIVPLILKNTFGLGETVTGAVMALDNVLALLLLPLFGALSDKTNTPLGRRTPYILVGTLLATSIMLLIPYADSSKNLLFFFVALGAVLLSMGLYRSPAVALMPDLTPKPLRSKANAIINLMGAIGGIYTLICVKVLIGPGENPSYLPIFIAVAALMLLAIAVLLTTVREKKLAAEIAALEGGQNSANDEELPTGAGKGVKLPRPVFRSLCFLLASVFFWFMAYNAVTTAFSRYATEVWGLQSGGFADCLMIATVAAVLTYIPVGALASRFGRKRVILCGIVLMAAAFTAGIFFINYSPLLNVVFAVVGIGWATINVNSYPMVVEMSATGDIGRYTGFYYTFSMAAQITTPIVSGFLLEHVSYRILFPYAAIFMAIAFCTMIFVRHGDNKPTK